MSLMLHRLGLLKPSLAPPEPTVPDAFAVGDWDIDPGDEEADVTINSLPNDGGATITDIEYRLDGGSWVSSGGTTSFAISGLTNDQEYDVELRAVNSVGAGAASDTKQVTPAAGGGAFDPSTQPIWLDPSDLSTMFEERTGESATTQSSVNGVVGSWRNKGALGGWAVAATDGARPTLRLSGGVYHLESAVSGNALRLPVNVSAPTVLWAVIGVRWTAAGSYPQAVSFKYDGSDPRNFDLRLEDSNGTLQASLDYVTGSSPAATRSGSVVNADLVATALASNATVSIRRDLETASSVSGRPNGDVLHLDIMWRAVGDYPMTGRIYQIIAGYGSAGPDDAIVQHVGDYMGLTL